MQYYPDPNYTAAGVAPWQNNLDYPEHFNKDLFWNWVGKVDHNFSPNDRAYFRWGENERNEIRNTTAIRSGPAQDGQLPLWRANRALVGDWVHIFGAGTVFNLRASYTYFLEWSYSEDSLGFDATEFWPSSLVDQLPSASLDGIFPRINIEEFASLSRGSAPNRNRNYSIQPNVSMTRGRHNIRSGLDMRWTNVYNENYNNSGGLLAFTRAFTRSTLNSTSALEGNAFASFLLGAPSSGQVDVNPMPHYEWLYVAPWIQDDWKISNRLTLNLGFRWDVNGSVKEAEQHAELRVRSDHRQSGVGARRSAGDGRPHVRRRGRRPRQAVEDGQGQLPGRVGAAYSLNEKTVLRGGWGKYFLNPTGQGFNNGFSNINDADCVERRQPHADLRARQPVSERHSGPAGQLPGPADLPRAGPSFSNPDFIVPNVHQFSIGVQRELPKRISLDVTYAGSRSSRHRGELGWLQRAVGGVPGAVRRDARWQPLALRPAGGQPVSAACPDSKGTTRFTTRPALALRAGAAVHRVRRLQPEPAEPGQDAVRLDAVRGQQAVGEGVTINVGYTWVPRWTERAPTPRPASATPTSTRCRSCRTAAPTSRTANTASPPRACGSCRGTATRRASRATCSAAGRSRRCSSTSPDSPGTCPATSIWHRASISRTSRCPARRRGSSSTA